MICFGFIYTQFVSIFYDIYNQLLIGMTGSSDPVVPVYKNLGLNVFGAFLYLIIAIQLVLLYFQFLTRGFEMLILKGGVVRLVRETWMISVATEMAVPTSER